MGSIDDFIQIGKEAKELEKEKRDKGKDIDAIEDIEKENKDFAEKEKNKEEKK